MAAPAISAHGHQWMIFCISSGRVGNVAKMQAALGADICWVVPEDEARDYALVGARGVIPVAPHPTLMPLAAQRNAALSYAQQRDVICVQTDDDLNALKFRTVDGKAAKTSLDTYLELWAEAFKLTGAYLAGCAPLPNAYFSNGQIKEWHWIMAQLFAVRPGSELRFDPRTTPREDYDFTCQHLERYGRVARHDALLPDYKHWGNRGGCQDWRTEQRSREVNELLLARWPQYLRPNPRRAGELLLKAAK